VRLAQIMSPQGRKEVVFKDNRWQVITDMFAQVLTFTGESFEDNGVVFLSPVQPRVILAMAHNGTPDQINNPAQAFHKSSRTAVGFGDSIYKDLRLGRLEVECELTAVIGKTARKLTLGNALEHVLGFTIGNDVTLPEQTPGDHLLLQTKNGDGFTPLGPWIETEFPNFDNSTMFVRVNGKQVIETSTNQLARGVAEQLVHITKYTTLGPGDVVLGGSPMSMYPVEPGDIVELEIIGLGVLINPIVKL